MKTLELTPQQWQQVHDARTEWLAAGLSTDLADRPTAETAITEMYRLIGKPKPQFVWVDSPASAMLAVWLLGDGLKTIKTQFWSQLWSQLGSQLWEQLGDQLGSQLGSQLGEQLGGQLREHVYRSFWGAFEAYWIAHYEVPRRLGIVTYPAEASRRLDLWADIARSTGPWWPYENIVICSERPSVIRMEGTGSTARLHCPDGPTVAYRDGWALHSWHGTRVPADLIEDGWSTDRILKEPNAEIRRCAIERLGWDRFITDAKLEQVGCTVPDPGNCGQTLALYDVPEAIYDEPVRVLLVTNGSVERDGTRRRFGLTVPAHIADPVEAAAWTFDFPIQAYRALEVRR